MDISESIAGVEKELEPGALQALKVPLSYEEFRQACLRTYINVAVRECGGNRRRASMKIGTTEATICRGLKGERLAGQPGPKRDHAE